MLHQVGGIRLNFIIDTIEDCGLITVVVVSGLRKIWCFIKRRYLYEIMKYVTELNIALFFLLLVAQIKSS